MKKIFLFLFFFFPFSVFAGDNVYLNPTWDFISSGASFTGSISATDTLSPDTFSVAQFCGEFASSYVSHTTTTNTFPVFMYDTSLNVWYESSDSQRVDSITCNDSLGASSSISWTGDVTTRDYLQLLVFKEGQYFINQDIFFYLLVMSLLGVLLLKTLVKIVSISFASGFFISSGKNILGKK